MTAGALANLYSPERFQNLTAYADPLNLHEQPDAHFIFVGGIIFLFGVVLSTLARHKYKLNPDADR